MKILYCDTELVVCVKPAGVLSEGALQDERTMPGLIAKALREAGTPPSAIYPVHRLDRETCGIMVYALTSSAAASLSAAAAERRMKKQYVALVHGKPVPPTGQMRDLLYYDRRRNKSFPVKRQRAGVKEALLFYELLSYDEQKEISRVLVTLDTGRTHQIRVQFASRKMPLVGDRPYGAPATDEKGLGLCAVSLSFPHPKTEKIMQFTLPT